MNGIIYVILMCCVGCLDKSGVSSKSFTFEGYEADKTWENRRYPLDVAIEKSQKECKPILLWVSNRSAPTDVSLIKYLETSRLTMNYLADSISYCKLFVDEKLSPRKIKNAKLKSLLQDNIDFKSEGKLNIWICDHYFDSLSSFFIMVNPCMRKLTNYCDNACFDHDTVSFLNFLKKGSDEYKRIDN